jgi:hypothetical protein
MRNRLCIKAQGFSPTRFDQYGVFFVKGVKSGQRLVIEKQESFTAQTKPAINRRSSPSLRDHDGKSKFDGSILDRPRVSKPNWLPSSVRSNPKFAIRDQVPISVAPRTELQ